VGLHSKGLLPPPSEVSFACCLLLPGQTLTLVTHNEGLMPSWFYAARKFPRQGPSPCLNGTILGKREPTRCIRFHRRRLPRVLLGPLRARSFFFASCSFSKTSLDAWRAPLHLRDSNFLARWDVSSDFIPRAPLSDITPRYPCKVRFS